MILSILVLGVSFLIHSTPSTSSDVGLIAYFESGCPAGWTSYNNLVGRFAIGVGSYSGLREDNGDDSAVYSIGATGGETQHKLTESEMPSHNHNNGEYEYILRQTGSKTVPYSDSSSSEPDVVNTKVMLSAGSDDVHNNMPPYYALYACQKVTNDNYTSYSDYISLRSELITTKESLQQVMHILFNLTNTPTLQPSFQPTTQPIVSTTLANVVTTDLPTNNPSNEPSEIPTSVPSSYPSSDPSYQPSGRPSNGPTSGPSGLPSSVPTSVPSSLPTMVVYSTTNMNSNAALGDDEGGRNGKDSDSFLDELFGGGGSVSIAVIIVIIILVVLNVVFIVTIWLLCKRVNKISKYYQKSMLLSDHNNDVVNNMGTNSVNALKMTSTSRGSTSSHMNNNYNNSSVMNNMAATLEMEEPMRQVSQMSHNSQSNLFNYGDSGNNNALLMLAKDEAANMGTSTVGGTTQGRVAKKRKNTRDGSVAGTVPVTGVTGTTGATNMRNYNDSDSNTSDSEQMYDGRLSKLSRNENNNGGMNDGGKGKDGIEREGRESVVTGRSLQTDVGGDDGGAGVGAGGGDGYDTEGSVAAKQ